MTELEKELLAALKRTASMLGAVAGDLEDVRGSPVIATSRRLIGIIGNVLDFRNEAQALIEKIEK